MNVKEKLTGMLNQFGVPADTYSIDDPKDYVLNFARTENGYAVWFQDASARYDCKEYPDLGEAVYEFATRLLPTIDADQIAKAFHDPDLVVYPH